MGEGRTREELREELEALREELEEAKRQAAEGLEEREALRREVGLLRQEAVTHQFLQRLLDEVKASFGSEVDNRKAAVDLAVRLGRKDSDALQARVAACEEALRIG